MQRESWSGSAKEHNHRCQRSLPYSLPIRTPPTHQMLPSQSDQLPSLLLITPLYTRRPKRHVHTKMHHQPPHKLLIHPLVLPRRLHIRLQERLSQPLSAAKVVQQIRLRRKLRDIRSPRPAARHLPVYHAQSRAAVLPLIDQDIPRPEIPVTHAHVVRRQLRAELLVDFPREGVIQPVLGECGRKVRVGVAVDVLGGDVVGVAEVARAVVELGEPGAQGGADGWDGGGGGVRVPGFEILEAGVIHDEDVGVWIEVVESGDADAWGGWGELGAGGG